jgi:hypothetical protein
MPDEELLLDGGAVLQVIPPPGPWLQLKLRKPAGAIRMDGIRRIALRGQRKRPGWSLDPRLVSVHEYKAIGWRGERTEEQRVIPPCSNAGDSTGRESAQPVRFQPLGVKGHVQWQSVVLHLRYRPINSRRQVFRCSYLLLVGHKLSR